MKSKLLWFLFNIIKYNSYIRRYKHTHTIPHSLKVFIFFNSFFILSFQHSFLQNFELQISSPSLPSPPKMPYILIAPFHQCALPSNIPPFPYPNLLSCPVGQDKFLCPITCISYLPAVRKNNSQHFFLKLWIPSSLLPVLPTHLDVEGKQFNIGWICVGKWLLKQSCCIRLTIFPSTLPCPHFFYSFLTLSLPKSVYF